MCPSSEGTLSPLATFFSLQLQMAQQGSSEKEKQDFLIADLNLKVAVATFKN